MVFIDGCLEESCEGLLDLAPIDGPLKEALGTMVPRCKEGIDLTSIDGPLEEALGTVM